MVCGWNVGCWLSFEWQLDLGKIDFSAHAALRLPCSWHRDKTSAPFEVLFIIRVCILPRLGGGGRYDSTIPNTWVVQAEQQFNNTIHVKHSLRLVYTFGFQTMP